MRSVLTLALFILLHSLVFGQYIDPDLVGHWKFDGNFNDASNFGNHGTATNVTLTTDRFGVANKAAAFNGVNSVIVIPNSPSLNPTNSITISAWIYMNVVLNPGRIVDKHTPGTGDGYNFDVSPTSFQKNTFRFVGGSCNTFSPQIIYEKVWYHVTVIYNRGTTTLFLNGFPVNSEILTSIDLSTNTWPLHIGGSHPISAYPSNYSFDGVIDDVRVYKRALSNKEVLFISRLP